MPPKNNGRIIHLLAIVLISCLMLSFSKPSATLAFDGSSGEGESSTGVIYQTTGSANLETGEFVIVPNATVLTQTQAENPPELSADPQVSGITVMFEDFESTFPAGDWTAFDADGATNGEYYWGRTSYKQYAGVYSAWPARLGADGYSPLTDSPYYPNNANSWMVYGPFDLSDATAATLGFFYWTKTELNTDWFGFYASADGATFYGNLISGDSGGWQIGNLDLTAVPTLGDVTGDSSVWIAFAFASNASVTDNGPFVDNVHLQKNVSIPATPGYLYADSGAAYDSIVVGCTTVSYATYYKIWRSTSTGDPGILLSGSDTDCYYTDTTASPGVYYYRVQACNSAGCSGYTDWDPGFLKPSFGDYDGNGSTDLAVRRGGKWYIQGVGNFSWGIPSDIPVPADYDGDGDTDIAVFRDGKWFIKDIGTFNYGIAGDVPVPADYNGDGAAELAVRRGGKWYIQGVGNFGWGLPTDIPVPGDYNGDGAAEIAVFRNGKWFNKDVGTFSYGIAGDVPIPYNYNNNGSIDLAVRRGGKWYIQDVGMYSWGIPTDIPVPGDYTGGTWTEIAVFRDGKWLIMGEGTFTYGIAGDYPLPAPDTNADGDPYQ